MRDLQLIVARVVHRGLYGQNHGTYSVTLTLACGCEVVRKGSQEPRIRARCRGDCIAQLRDATTDGALKAESEGLMAAAADREANG